jgi:large conductance mechanosensitive channel
MLKEFKEFAIKGNMVDMAVGIIMGAAFGGVVNSLVSDIMMPPLGLATGGMDFSNLGLVLKAAEGDKPATVLKYGVFINVLISFLITAFAVFMLVKNINRFRRQQAAAPAPPPAPSAEEKLLTEIRDLLKAR